MATGPHRPVRTLLSACFWGLLGGLAWPGLATAPVAGSAPLVEGIGVDLDGILGHCQGPTRTLARSARASDWALPGSVACP